jgi:enoyl-CoA hydratase/carnithine racemase
MSLRVEQDGRVRRITLASPARRNLLDHGLATELLNELVQASVDPLTGAIQLEAEGQIFCGGAEAGAAIPEDLFTFGARLSKPVIAAVQGVAVSAGLALVANAHVVIAAQGSSFGLTDIRQGHCNLGILHAVSRAIGERRARELALTGRIFSTPEALAWGLVHSVVPAFELDDRATAVATAVANANPDAVQAVLGALRRATAV